MFRNISVNFSDFCSMLLNYRWNLLLLADVSIKICRNGGKFQILAGGQCIFSSDLQKKEEEAWENCLISSQENTDREPRFGIVIFTPWSIASAGRIASGAAECTASGVSWESNMKSTATKRIFTKRKREYLLGGRIFAMHRSPWLSAVFADIFSRKIANFLQFKKELLYSVLLYGFTSVLTQFSTFFHFFGATSYFWTLSFDTFSVLHRTSSGFWDAFRRS